MISRIQLEAEFRLHRLNFEGQWPNTFVANIRDHLQDRGLSAINIFGYSSGDYVACTLAHDAPELVKRIVILGTKFYWDEAAVGQEIKYLDVIETKVRRFAEMLAKRHTAGEYGAFNFGGSN